MSNICYFDGKIVPEENAAIPINDMAILRGYGIFDFLRTYGGRPFHLTDHLSRFRRSAEILGLDLPKSTVEIRKIVTECLGKCEHEESNIRLVLTGGPAEDYITPAGKPRLAIMVTETPPLQARWYEDGVKVVTTAFQRQLPEAKTVNYAAAVLALKEASRKNAMEAVYIGERGNLKEGTTSNFFAFVDGKLVTSGTEGILSGITRKVVLELAAKEFDIEIRDVCKDELNGAKGAFISSSVRQVLPVVRIDDIVLGDGKPSEETREVLRMFREYTERYARGEITE